MQRTMNLLLSCDDRIAKYIPALLASVYENHKDVSVRSFLMHSSISSETVNVIKTFADENAQEFAEIRVNESDFDFFCQIDPKRLDSFPVEAYYHFLAPQYLPEDVDRCMYLDVDTICDSDLYSWYCTDFEDRFYVSSERYKKYNYYCFNSGIFLINVKKLRREGINTNFFREKCLELSSEKEKELMGDQEFLGFAFRNYQDNGFLCRSEDGLNLRIIWQRDIAIGLKKMPEIKLVHYNTYFKAWKYYFDKSFLNSYIGRKISGINYDFSFLSENVLYLYALFWKYAEKAPYYEEIYHDALIAAAEIKRNIPFELNASKYEMLLRALEIKENCSEEGFIIPQAAYNGYGISWVDEGSYSEYRTQCYIREQWIVFPLRRQLKCGETLSVKIKCEYKTSRKIYLFLSDYSLKTRHLPALSGSDYNGEITADADGYSFLCLSSNSFPDKGDFIRFFEISAEPVYKKCGCGNLWMVQDDQRSEAEPGIKIYDMKAENTCILFRTDDVDGETMWWDIRLIDAYNDKLPTTFYKIRACAKYEVRREQGYWKIDVTEVCRMLDVVFDKTQTMEFRYLHEGKKEAIEAAGSFTFNCGNIVGVKNISRKTFGLKLECVSREGADLIKADYADGHMSIQADYPKGAKACKLSFCRRYNAGSDISACERRYEREEGAFDIPLSEFQKGDDEYRKVYDVYCEYKQDQMDFRRILKWGGQHGEKEYKFEYGCCEYKLYCNVHGQVSMLKTRILKPMYADGLWIDEKNFVVEVDDCHLVLCPCKQKKHELSNDFIRMGDKKIRIEELCRPRYQDGWYRVMAFREEQLYQLKYRSVLELTAADPSGWLWQLSGSEDGIFLHCEKAIPRTQIAAWGSCYLRDMFKQQYNPMWRKYFEIVDEYFWPSVFSIASKPVSLVSRELKNARENQKNVDRELLKTAISGLEKSAAQYLLLDFFADAVHGARQFQDGSFVGQGLAFSPNGALMNEYEEFVQTKSRMVDFQTEGYLELWEQKCDRFCGMLRDAGFENKVILVKGTFNVMFCDGKEIKNMNHRRIKGAAVEKNILDAKLSLWDKMDDYFLSKMPNTSVLDIRSYQYFADLSGKSIGPQHFEANYYRTLFAELCRLILN